jgi:hypothetical protein
MSSFRLEPCGYVSIFSSYQRASRFLLMAVFGIGVAGTGSHQFETASGGREN